MVMSASITGAGLMSCLWCNRYVVVKITRSATWMCSWWINMPGSCCAESLNRLDVVLQYAYGYRSCLVMVHIGMVALTFCSRS